MDINPKPKDTKDSIKYKGKSECPHVHLDSAASADGFRPLYCLRSERASSILSDIFSI